MKRKRTRRQLIVAFIIFIIMSIASWFTLMIIPYVAERLILQILIEEIKEKAKDPPKIYCFNHEPVKTLGDLYV